MCPPYDCKQNVRSYIQFSHLPIFVFIFTVKLYNSIIAYVVKNNHIYRPFLHFHT